MANKSNVSVCPTCGQKIVLYKHGINKTLVSCLWALHNAGGLARLDKLNLNNTQFTNFQKLKYFHLVVATGSKNEWQITREGVEFLQGHHSVPKFVITRLAVVRNISEERVFITEIKDCIDYRVAWQTQASQPTLFDVGDKK